MYMSVVQSLDESVVAISKVTYKSSLIPKDHNIDQKNIEKNTKVFFRNQAEIL